MKALDIMTKPPLTISESASLEQAAQCMLDRGVGCLLVTGEDGRLTGILTESDFAAKQQGIPFSLYRFPQVFGEWISQDGVERMYAAARSKPVRDFMSRKVVTAGAADSIGAVVETMCRSGFHRLPVLDGELPVGVISRRDLLRLMAAPSPESAA